MIFSDAQPVQFWLSRLSTYNETEPDGIFTKCYCAPFEADDNITVQFRDTAWLTRKLVVYDSNGTFATMSFTEVVSGFYQVSFTPRSIGLTDSEIQLKITDGIITEMAKSDCLSIKETHPETVLINYHNNRILASLSSAIGTPDPDFNLRIPGRFFLERYPVESEDMDLSNSRSLQLNSQVKKQKQLEVKHVPYYMHLKIQLALSFQNVTINDLEYFRAENYEIEEGRKTFPLKKATCWLTEKEYIVRNVL